MNIVDLIGQEFTIVDNTFVTKSTLEHDSLIIWPETNSYFWYSKGFGGGSYQWLRYEVGLSDNEIEDYIQNDIELQLILPDSEFVIKYPIGHKRHNDYMLKRKININTIKTFDLEDYNNNVIIPLYDNYGIRCGSMIRDVTTNLQNFKYRKYITHSMCNLWPYWLLNQRFDKPVFIFEGAWSVMRWYQVSNATIVPLALLGTSANDDTIKLLNGVENVTFILDNDKSNAGDTVYKKITNSKLFDKTLNWRFIKPDIYPDEMNDEIIQKYLRYLFNKNAERRS